MNVVFFVLIGVLVFEGINALPILQNNDLKIRSFNKHPKNRRMVHKDVNTEFKPIKKPIYKSSKKSEDKSVENVISAINTGVKTFMASQNKSEIIGNIAKSLVYLVNDNGNKSVFRSKAEEYIKPELIHFRNDPDDKPSVMLELNSQSIINGIKDLLHSNLVNKLMQHYSKEAAMVYRTVQIELEKSKQRQNN